MPRGLLPQDTLKSLRPLLNYVNVSPGSGSELAAFCNEHKVPTNIHIESAAGRIVATRDTDRKAILLDRIMRYLETGEMPAPTTFRRQVISDAPLPKPLAKSDPVYYGQYKNGNPTIERLLKSLTGGVSTFCAVGQEVIRKFWSNDVAPTYEEFAKVFVTAYSAHKTSDNPEWAYLNDLQQASNAGKQLNKRQWRDQIRPEKARQALAILDQVKVRPSKDERPIPAFFEPTAKPPRGKRSEVVASESQQANANKRRLVTDDDGRPFVIK